MASGGTIEQYCIVKMPSIGRKGFFKDKTNVESLIAIKGVLSAILSLNIQEPGELTVVSTRR